MYAGFPRSLLPDLRCPRDRAPLAVSRAAPPGGPIVTGQLTCTACQGDYPVEGGVAVLLPSDEWHPEAAFERRRRDEVDEAAQRTWETSPASRAEMDATLRSLEPLEGRSMLELGCGAGRFTARLAPVASRVLAIDFSPGSLRRVAARVEPSWNLGLALGDCARFAVAPGRFDRVLSTLVSNLPEAGHRGAMLRLAAEALTPDGRFVFTTHHHGLRDRLARRPQAGHYEGSGIFRYNFRRRELLVETGRHFAEVRCRPILVEPPLAGRVGLPAHVVSPLAERVPVLRELGELLLVEATRPAVC